VGPGEPERSREIVDVVRKQRNRPDGRVGGGRPGRQMVAVLKKKRGVEGKY